MATDWSSSLIWKPLIKSLGMSTSRAWHINVVLGLAMRVALTTQLSLTASFPPPGHFHSQPPGHFTLQTLTDREPSSTQYMHIDQWDWEVIIGMLFFAGQSLEESFLQEWQSP